MFGAYSKQSFLFFTFALTTSNLPFLECGTENKFGQILLHKNTINWENIFSFLREKTYVSPF